MFQSLIGPAFDLAGTMLGGETAGQNAAAETLMAAPSSVAGRNPINIAPVGVNLGAVIAPFNEGSPENGGFGVDMTSRLLPVQAGDVYFSKDKNPTGEPLNIFPYAIFASAGLLAYLILR